MLEGNGRLGRENKKQQTSDLCAFFLSLAQENCTAHTEEASKSVATRQCENCKLACRGLKNLHDY